MSTGGGGIKTANSRTSLWQGLNSLVAGSQGGLGVLEGVAGAVAEGKGGNLGRPQGRCSLSVSMEVFSYLPTGTADSFM